MDLRIPATFKQHSRKDEEGRWLLDMQQDAYVNAGTYVHIITYPFSKPEQVYYSLIEFELRE